MVLDKIIFYFKGQKVNVFFANTPINPKGEEFIYLSGDKEGKDHPVVAFNKKTIRTIQGDQRELKYEVKDDENFDVIDYLSNINDDDKDIQ